MLTKLMTALASFRREESGATAIEYAIIVGVIAAGVAVGATTFGGDVTGALNGMSTELSAMK